jgi:hypothetical protein
MSLSELQRLFPLTLFIQRNGVDNLSYYPDLTIFHQLPVVIELVLTDPNNIKPGRLLPCQALSLS